MSIYGLGQRVWDVSTTWLGKLFILSIFLVAGSSVLIYGTVHHTAQSEFCNSCHIMEPYYQSWQNSKHAGVACIECHYEPGSLETLGGKFQALSQLAKYVTRTQGTKPWADVSDQSCLRSGCHSVRSLDGPVSFGAIKFDHRHHLLESRQGRRLRCTSCHSQIVQSEHVSVTSAVCITCHFMPGKESAKQEESGRCLACHEVPEQPVEVAGHPFVHAAFVERGVECKECHNPVVEGDGRVRKARCASCHSEVERIARIGEPEFLHEMHITKKKVECFECHDEIHHGLLPLERPEVAKHEGCGVCHASPHDSARMLFAGTGAVGVDAMPSRMYETRVVCEACHTGRSGVKLENGDARGELVVRAFAPDDSTHAADAAHGEMGHASTVAAAGNVDCIHCHGTGYDGMLGQWQAAVTEQLERLKPMLAEVEQKLAADPQSAARTPVEEARRNLALVAMDGSHGAHNVTYALAALRAAAERIDGARGALAVEVKSSAAADMPAVSKDGCTSCHAGAGRPATVWKGESAFPHRKHLAQGLECSTCHSTTEHGKPSLPREQCATCHHQESEQRDVSDCASCHAAQASMLAGTLPGFAEKPGTMAKVECSDCHGEAPTILRPSPAACVLCHKPGYDDMALAWKAEIETLAVRLGDALASPGAGQVDPQVVEQARKALDTVQEDHSGGAHNFELAKTLLEEALRSLQKP